jgi:hypothetical protein
MVTRNHVHRFAYKLPQLLGENGTRIFLRLSAFIVLCIGVVVKKLRGIKFLRQVADQIALTIANVLAYTDISTSGTSSHISLRWADFHLCTPRAVRTSSGDRRFHAADSLNISCVGSHGRAATGTSAKGADAKGYPTVDRVEFVLECMQKNGGKQEFLYKCACVLDRIAEQYSYDDFVEASTAVGRSRSTHGNSRRPMSDFRQLSSRPHRRFREYLRIIIRARARMKTPFALSA